jgi:hypothetical protein
VNSAFGNTKFFLKNLVLSLKELTFRIKTYLHCNIMNDENEIMYKILAQKKYTNYDCEKVSIACDP